MVGEFSGPGRGPQAGRLEAILYGHGQTVERTPGLACAPRRIGLVGALAGALGVEGYHAVHGRAEPLDPLEIVLQQLATRNPTALQRFDQIARRSQSQRGHLGSCLREPRPPVASGGYTLAS